MGLLRQWFGPSQAEVWRQLAEQTGGQFSESFWKGRRVDVEVGPWTVTLDTYTVSNGDSSTTYTRMRAPFVNPDGFRFTVYRASVFSGFGRALGMQDIRIGHEPFDTDFIVRSNDEARVRDLLSAERLRRLLARQPRVHLEVRDDEGWFGTRFPEGVDELRFEASGGIRDLPLLHRLYELFGETLDGLCRIGSAYESDPGVRL